MKDTLDGKIWLNRKPGMHSLDTETGNILWSKITDTECKEIDINCDPTPLQLLFQVQSLQDILME